jgi:hypothetical protein
LAIGAGSGLCALFFWYGIEAMRRGRHHRVRGDEMNEPVRTPVKDKIEQVLTEVRVVLPGAQALLGFQLASMLVEGFDKLPASSKYIHTASLLLIALSTVLLMTPAAYHRLVEAGEDTEHFHRFAARVLIAAIIPLVLGVAGDLFVVRKVSASDPLAGAVAGTTLASTYGLWFGLTLILRARRAERRRPPLAGWRPVE